MKLVRVISGRSMARFSWRDFPAKDPLCMCYLCLDDTMYVGVRGQPRARGENLFPANKFVSTHSMLSASLKLRLGSSTVKPEMVPSFSRESRHNLPRNNVFLLLSNEDTEGSLIDSSGAGLYGG